MPSSLHKELSNADLSKEFSDQTYSQQGNSLIHPLCDLPK